MLGRMQVAEYTKQIYLMPFQTSVLVNRITTVLAVEGGGQQQYRAILNCQSKAKQHI